MLARAREADMTARDPSPMQYRIRIRGHLDPAWTDWFAELALTQKDDGTTSWSGHFPTNQPSTGSLPDYAI